MTQFANDVVAYVTGTVEQSPEFTSVESFVAANPSASSALVSWNEDVSGLIANGVTSAAAVVSALPTELQSFYSSIYEAEISLAYKDGVLTKTSAGAAPTGSWGMGVAGAAAGAAVAGMLAL